jgi:FtsZ-binding cell division protein ZapB
MSLPTHEEIRTAYQQGVETVIQLFDTSIQELQAENQDLRNQLNTDFRQVFMSHN